ncbi:MAG TPA: Sapep family Mn(2+)-dependent dipeptidase [Fimbriimonas sp.]
MGDPNVAKLAAWLKDHEAELLSDYVAMLKIPSLESDPEPNAPYGRENRRALDLALALSEKYGMKTTDLEGHLGYADFGRGGPLVMSLGHLDVVPTGPGWKHDPFGAEIENGYVYARGATDDKGPTMASFYAMRAIKECFPDLEVRYRQAFGCNEESGFGCVHRYVETEEAPTFGVAPDSGWPCYNREKGIANLEVAATVPESTMALVELEGGQRPNIVIDSCSARVRVDPDVRAEVEGNLADAWDRNVTFAWDGNLLGVYAIGKAAHGSSPFSGDSAAIRALRFLAEIAPLSAKTFFEELLALTHVGGAGLGIAGADDESQDLTCNLGIVKLDGREIDLLFNIRYPVTWTGEMLREKCMRKLATYTSRFELSVVRDSPPLFFPADHPLVKTIIDVYEAETGERKEPGSMGGGTYARAVANTISIGTGWEGDGAAHETDERLAIESLFRMSRIYAHLFYRLGLEALGQR